MMIKFPRMWSAAIAVTGLLTTALIAGCGGPSASGPLDNRPAANAQAEIARRMGSPTGPPSLNSGATAPTGAPTGATTAPRVPGMPAGVPIGPPR